MTEPMRSDEREENPISALRVEQPGGCGVVGCLYVAVGIFVVLLLAMLVIGVLRLGQAA